ncbi:MAG: lysophospholipid acyltransferase family protein [Candidatus Omnitrophota bacterium]
MLYIIYRIGQFFATTLPVRFSFWFASRVADIHFLLSKKDRVLVMGNLEHVLGSDRKKIRRVAREVLRNFGKYLVEFLRFSKMGDKYVEKHVKIEGAQNLRDALKQNKGAVLFSAHLGNWEWGGGLVSRLGIPIHAIAWAHKNKRVNDFFVAQRGSKGMGSIPLGGSIRTCMRLLAKNETIAILPDRDFSDNSIKVDFFGKPAYFPVGIGILAIRAKCPLVPVFITRESGDKHKLTIERPIDYEITNNKEEDIKNVVQKTLNTIERYVAKYPDQWFMFHDPWAGNTAGSI